MTPAVHVMISIKAPRFDLPCFTGCDWPAAQEMLFVLDLPTRIIHVTQVYNVQIDPLLFCVVYIFLIWVATAFARGSPLPQSATKTSRESFEIATGAAGCSLKACRCRNNLIPS